MTRNKGKGLAHMKKALRLVTVCLVAVLLCGGCAKKESSIYIAQQFGTAYVPIALMQEAGLMEKHLPQGTKVEWSQLGNTAAIREAMLAGKADVGCMAISPFLIGLEAGMPWRICAGLSQMPIGLVARSADCRTLADITPQDRIALPQPGSIQHILLSMAAQRELGDPLRFDNQLVTMNHPDGMNALLAGADVTLHFTTAPYLGQELEAGMSLVLTGEEAMGQPFTGIVAVAREGFHDDTPEAYEAFQAALAEAMDWIARDPREVAELLGPTYGMTPEALLAEMNAQGSSYSTAVEGVEAFAAFMLDTGYLKQSYTPESLVFDGVQLQ